MNNLDNLNRDYSDLKNSGTGLVGDRIFSDFIENSELTKNSTDSYDAKVDVIENLFKQNNVNIDIADGSNISQSQYDNYVNARKNGLVPEEAINHLS